MLSVKKDWNFDINRSARRAQCIITIMGIVFVGLSFFLSENFKILFGGIYSSAFTIGSLVFFLQPIFTMKNMLPQIGVKKPYMDISNIPLTKKELFISQLKENSLPIILFVVIGIILNSVLYSVTYGGGLNLIGEMLPVYMSQTLDAFLIALIIFFQSFVEIILHLVKGMKKSKVFAIIFGADAIVVTFFILLERFFIDKALFLFIAGGTFFILSLIAFIVCWKNFEKVCN